ncbi:PepSY domain-containing protein [Thiohalomonas denitrificans]|uniref:Peptidase propeptide and YPEB domain-containing protein n=1 Tax=Thiohalomonas denitrificans TaxID=415747 RepID=A0A1G5PUU5_9GAMM|nr:PepSY domain-containing protein [Thiohalomonas denitrificans]SCZ52809.1 Peptidase propeptide and YPEB domain-containing protein [Thiohalomonas denitrificans]
MKTSHAIFAIALSAAAVGGTAFAAPGAAAAPARSVQADNWLTIPAIYDKVIAAGYRDIDEIEREDNGYEVKAISPDGQRAKLQVDPISGDVVNARAKGDKRRSNRFDMRYRDGNLRDNGANR